MLHYAARYGHKDIVKYLLTTGPSILLNLKDGSLYVTRNIALLFFIVFIIRGQTPLHKAAAYKWRGICCMLVAAGASLDITDRRGLTPRLLALECDDVDLAAYLESK